MEKPQKELLEALDEEYEDWEAYSKVLQKLFPLNDSNRIRGRAVRLPPSRIRIISLHYVEEIIQKFITRWINFFLQNDKF